MITEKLIESDILVRIMTSNKIDASEKQSFAHLISYFTPSEIEELKLIL
jgi:hypothetical protein